jgi:hypothetical protein
MPPEPLALNDMPIDTSPAFQITGTHAIAA